VHSFGSFPVLAFIQILKTIPVEIQHFSSRGERDLRKKIWLQSMFTKRICLPSPSFCFHGQAGLRKGIDTEGRVLEPLECGDHWILRETLVGIKNEGLVRVSDSMPIPLKVAALKLLQPAPLCLREEDPFLEAPTWGRVKEDSYLTRKGLLGYSTPDEKARY
jgi:hypothetical protein